MRKSLITALAAFGLLALLLLSWAGVHARHVVAANRVHALRQELASRAALPDSASDAGAPAVIRFASNPSPVPPFLTNDLDGNIISTAQWHGKVVLLNFWATWCPPCREEIPELIELSGRYKDRLQIVGISEDDSPPDQVREFAASMGINYPVVMAGRVMEDEYGGVPALPTSFLVNQDGGVVLKHVGLYPIEVYDREIRALLGMPVNLPIQKFEDTGQIFLKNAARATALPGVDFKGLTQDQTRAALKRMNSDGCTCGCKLTIAQCRISEPDCDTSTKLAADIVHSIRARRPASLPASTATP
ncbi:MAG TPA: TlpA disulfide reductase family protein [Candidatus Acidoferrales bacterium]|nr:TlpA disulfide reductase family protein [Candidatus Acidoferrales bacterium]